MRDRNNIVRTNVLGLAKEYYVERPSAQLGLSEHTLKTWLQNNIKNLERKHAWKTPLVTLLPLLLTLMTASFKNIFGLKAETCKSIWIMIILGIIVWLGYTIWRCIKSKSIDDMISDLKEDMVKIITE